MGEPPDRRGRPASALPGHRRRVKRLSRFRTSGQVQLHQFWSRWTQVVLAPFGSYQGEGCSSDESQSSKYGKRADLIKFSAFDDRAVLFGAAADRRDPPRRDKAGLRRRLRSPCRRRGPTLGVDVKVKVKHVRADNTVLATFTADKATVGPGQDLRHDSHCNLIGDWVIQLTRDEMPETMAFGTIPRLQTTSAPTRHRHQRFSLFGGPTRRR